MIDFAMIKWSDNALIGLKLPEVDYPIPIVDLRESVTQGGDISLERLVFWLFEYLDQNTELRERYERILLEIGEEHAPPTGLSDYWYRGISAPEWEVHLGQVDLSQSIVAWQCRDRVLAAFTRFERTSRVSLALYAPPCLRLLTAICGYGALQDMGGPINTMEYLQYATTKFGAAMDGVAGRDYLVNWEHGIGWNSPDLFSEAYANAKQLNPIPADWTAFYLHIFESLQIDTGRRALL